MYGSASITACSIPPPAACKLTVDISYAPYLFVLAQNTTGWVSCKKLTLNTKAWKCQASPGSAAFETGGTLQIETPGGNYASTYATAGPVYYYCAT